MEDLKAKVAAAKVMVMEAQQMLLGAEDTSIFYASNDLSKALIALDRVWCWAHGVKVQP